jgi:hypothetical protein
MKWLNVVLLAGALVAADMVTDGLVVTNAEARVGRPATPASVAGVARRTTRRVIRRTSIYVATLPAGCQTVVVEGTTLSQCGGTYYQASGSQFVVVEID